MNILISGGSGFLGSAYSEYKKIKEEMRAYQIAKQNVESFYEAQQSWDQETDLKKKYQQQR